MSPARVILNLTPRLQAQVLEGRVPSLYSRIREMILARGGEGSFRLRPARAAFCERPLFALHLRRLAGAEVR